jgi:hypothetical protein
MISIIGILNGMNAMPDFENDIFISYAHIDNQPLVEGQKGWIDEFHHALETRLDQFLGEECKVWRDKKLAGNDVFDEAIVSKFPKTALLVSVLSPRYTKSEWCLKELKAFFAAAAQSGGDRIGEKSRVFKVIKTHVPREEHPPELQGLLGYPFYEIEDVTDRPREFVIDPRDESYRKFRLKLDDLAYEISDLAKVIRHKKPEQAGTASGSSGEFIYLATVTSDLSEARDQIQRELRQRGYIMLPDKSWPSTAVDLESAIREDLQRAKLSIHLVGKNYGMIPEGADRSIVQWQVELARACSKSRELPCVLWVPPGLKPAEPRQEAFLTYLRSEVAGKDGAELIDANIEQLKTIIQDKLAGPSKKTEPSVRSNGKVRIYLVCHQRDLNDVPTIQQHLYQQDFEVVLPAREGDEAQVQDDHKENLIWCDAAMIYYGNGNEPWFRTKVRDLDKAFGLGRQKNWLAKAVYLAPPKTGPKETLLSHEALVIPGFESFSPDSLEPFVAQLKKNP